MEEGDTEEKESHVEGCVETCVQLGEILALHLSFTSCNWSVFCYHIQNNTFLSCIILELSQHPYNVFLIMYCSNWFMLYGITRSRFLLILVETEGPVSASSRVNCKWVPTSGLHYAARLHMSTNRRLPGLTVTKQPYTLTQLYYRPCDVIAPQNTKGWAPYGQESQPSKRKRMEPWRESAWQRQEASSMEMGSQPIRPQFGAKAVYNIKSAGIWNWLNNCVNI